MFRYALILCLLAGTTLQLPGAEVTWVGDLSSFWNADNWSGTNSPPLAGDALFFGPAGSAGTTLSNDFPNGLSLSGITFNTNASAYTISPSWAALTGDIVNNSTNLQILNLGHELRSSVRFDAAAGGLQFGVNNTINLNHNSLTVTGTHDTAINLTVSGAGTNSQLVKEGDGTLTLGANASFQGGLTINAGTVRVNGLANVAANTTTVNTGATLVISTDNTWGHAAVNVIAPLKLEGGRVTNAAAFTVFGPLTLNAGTLSGSAGVNASFQMYSLTKTVHVGGNGPSVISGPAADTNFFGGVHIGSSAKNTLTFDVADATADAAPDLIVSAALINRNAGQGGGAGALLKTGDGAMLLSGSNTYSGDTTIQQGALIIGGSGAISNSATIAVGTAAGSSALLDVSPLGAAFSPSATQPLKGYGMVTGDVVFASGARLIPGDSGSVGTIRFADTLTLGSGGTCEFDLFTPGSGDSNDLVAVGGMLDLNSNAVISLGNPAALAEGEYALFTHTGDVTGDLDPVIEYESRQGVALTNHDSAVWLSVDGTVADLYWTGASGTTWQTEGPASWHDGTGAETFFDLDNVLFDDRGLPHDTITVVGTVSPGALVVSNDLGHYTFTGSGAIGGTVGLVKQGSGALTLSNPNTFSGDTSIQGGTLLFSGAGTTSEDSAVYVGNGGTLTFNRHDTWGIGNTPTSARVSVFNGGLLVSGGRFTTLWDPMLSGGTVLLNGGANANYPAFQFGGTLHVGGTNTSVIEVGTGIHNLINIGGAGNGTLVLNVADATGDASTDLLVGAPLQNNQQGAGSLTKAGAGTVDLIATSTYTGNTIVEGGVLRIRDGGTLPNTAALITRTGGTLDISNGTVTVAATAGAVFGVGYGLVGTGAVTVSHGVLNIGYGGSRTFIGGGPSGGPFGNGILTLNEGGVVNVGPAGVDPNNRLWFNGYGTSDQSVLNLNPGGLLSTQRELRQGSGTLTEINFNGGLLQCMSSSPNLVLVATANVRDGGLRIDTQNNALTVAQALLHSTHNGDATIDGGLTKTGTGTLTLTSVASTYSGDVSVHAGELIAQAQSAGLNPQNSALGNPQVAGRTITVHSNALLVCTAHDVLGNAASTPLVRVLVDGGTFSSSHHLTTLGPVTLHGATLLADKGTAVGSRGAFDLNGTVSVTGDVSSLLVSTNGPDAIFRLNNTAPFVTTFDVGDGRAAADLVVAGELGNSWDLASAGLTKTGDGTIVLAQNNTYSGLTTVLDGALLVNGYLNPAGAVNVATNATLGGSGQVGAVTVQSGATVAPGAWGSIGALTVNGDMTLEEDVFFALHTSTTTGDVVHVNGLLTLPDRLNLHVIPLAAPSWESVPIITFGSVTGNTSNVHSWPVSGARGLAIAELQPNQIVLRLDTSGTLLILR